jgi:hypothetical protein
MSDLMSLAQEAGFPVVDRELQLWVDHDLFDAPWWPWALLESTGRSVDKQATGRDRSNPGATLNQDRLNGSQKVTTFPKVTEAAPKVVK